MQIPQIQLQSTRGQIEMITTPPQQSIEQPKAIVNLQQPQAEIVMETVPGQLTIDQTRAWASMDIKHIFDRIEENAQKGINDAMSGTARRASEGDEMMRIEYGGSALASQADRNSQMLNFDYNIGYIPPPFSVSMNYQPGRVAIQVNPKQVISQITSQKPIIDYTQGQVTTRMKQMPELSFNFVQLEV